MKLFEILIINETLNRFGQYLKSLLKNLFWLFVWFGVIWDFVSQHWERYLFGYVVWSINYLSVLFFLDSSRFIILYSIVVVQSVGCGNGHMQTQLLVVTPLPKIRECLLSRIGTRQFVCYVVVAYKNWGEPPYSRWIYSWPNFEKYLVYLLRV